jgi:hypothetical protein
MPSGPRSGAGDLPVCLGRPKRLLSHPERPTDRCNVAPDAGPGSQPGGMLGQRSVVLRHQASTAP